MLPFEDKNYCINEPQKVFDGITTEWSDKRQPIQHRLQFKKQV